MEGIRVSSLIVKSFVLNHYDNFTRTPSATGIEATRTVLNYSASSSYSCWLAIYYYAWLSNGGHFL